MENIKLTGLLRTFSKKEFRMFGKFVASPFFNGFSTIKKLYTELAPFYPSFKNRNFTPEIIYSKIYPNEKYDYRKMQNLISDILGHAEDFLAYINYSQNPLTKKKHLLDELYKRRLGKTFEKNMNEANAILTNFGSNGEEYFYNKYIIELMNGNYITQQKNPYAESNLKDINDSFINYFLIVILRLYSYTVNEQLLFKGEAKNLKLLNDILDQIRTNYTNEVPMVRIYYSIFMLVSEQEESFYNELKHLEREYRDIISDKESEDIHICLRNFCTVMVLKGEKRYLKEYFDISKEYLQQIQHNGSGFILNYVFMNIAITGLRYGEFEWVYSFIKEFENMLNPAYREETRNLVYAMYYFEKKEFESALSSLSKINFDDCHQKTHVRNLLLQVYYELDSFEPAISLLDSYKHFLKRDKTITEFYKKINSDFIKFYGKLIKVKMGEKKVSAGELKIKLSESSDFSNKEWIMRKTNELIKNS